MRLEYVVRILEAGIIQNPQSKDPVANDILEYESGVVMFTDASEVIMRIEPLKEDRELILVPPQIHLFHQGVKRHIKEVTRPKLRALKSCECLWFLCLVPYSV